MQYDTENDGSIEAKRLPAAYGVVTLVKAQSKVFYLDPLCICVLLLFKVNCDKPLLAKFNKDLTLARNGTSARRQFPLFLHFWKLAESPNGALKRSSRSCSAATGKR